MNANQAAAGYAELNTVLDQARRPCDSPTPVTGAQLRGLQHRWTTMLSARLDQAIEDAGSRPTADAVVAAWPRLAADQPVLRRLLDDELARPGVPLDLTDGELQMLALAAGLAGLDEPERRAVVLDRGFRTLLSNAAALRRAG